MNKIDRKTQDKYTLLEPLENAIHDIKIPLTIMYTKIQVLEETQDISDEVVDTLNVLKRNWFRIMKLLNDISDYEKITNGQIKPNFENLDIIKILSDITSASSSLAYKKEIKLNFKSSIQSKIMAVDKEILERVLLNLISNAIKYCRTGSDVVISAENDLDNIILSVKDNGNGIEKSKLDKIFERSVKSYNKNNIPSGSGIGFNIVKELIDLLKGQIYVKTDSNGTEINIILPYFEEASIKSKLLLDNFYSYNMLEIELSDDYNI